MKIACIGGGPAGLYFALLLKKAQPEHSIIVFERNKPDQTFGWGVVFSDETLGYLEENDEPTYRKITDTFAHWDSIDVFVRDQVLHSGGHGFSGIARRRLLEILQDRCIELGIEIKFETEVEDYDAIRREYDLVVAGDGVNSRARTLYADTFKPSSERGLCRYIWLGTPRIFNSFTFVFEECEHGIFQAHAYQFDSATSTFIVETDEQTWLRAGLDKMPIEDSVKWLEKLFAKHLQGNPLLTNRSSWINFPTIRNERWSHDNLVIMGDAVHTAHFSIGSGTKLAMEDSIALVKEIVKCRSRQDVPAALAAYEAERRPMVDRIQRAAHDSRSWFENVRRYWHFEPREFAFSMLTRSKRISYDNLRMRDAQCVDDVSKTFVERAYKDQGFEVPQNPPPPMFTPLRLRELTIENRVGVSPMCMYSATNGTPNDFHIVHYGARAMGGVGLLFTEMTNVSAQGRITPGCTGIYTDEHTAAWKRIVDFVHGNSRAKMCLQLGHAGRKGSTKLPWESKGDEALSEGAWEIIGPSAVRYKDITQMPREMTRDDMDRVKGEFVAATQRAIDAGFDMIELHMAHGYLLSSFLTPLANRRSDQYGGSLENRLRFPLEVFDAVRAAWPKNRPMSVRISATDWAPGGLDLAEATQIARALKEHGLDIIDVSTGQTVAEAQPQYGRMFQVPYSDAIRNDVGLRTMTVGAITTADQINTIITSSRADICLLAREHLRDPAFTLRAASQQGYLDISWPKQYFMGKPVPRLSASWRTENAVVCCRSPSHKL